MPLTKALKSAEEEFDGKFPREGGDSISRFCRLDFPDGDDRSIKSFLSAKLKEFYELGARDHAEAIRFKSLEAEEALYKAIPQDLRPEGTQKYHDGYCAALKTMTAKSEEFFKNITE